MEETSSKKRVRSDSENVVQSACADALAVHFDRDGIEYRQLWTYANQQGDSDNKFCADLVGVINSSTMLLMEFKSLDHTSEELMAFDEEQFKEAKKMQGAGIPLVYCYDNYTPLPYYHEPKPKDWPREVLKAINASLPRDLAGIKPRRAHHDTLLDWIDGRLGEQPKNCVQAFGKAIGCMMPNMARNKLLSVLFSKEKNEALLMNEAGLERFNDWLAAQNPKRDIIFQGKINALRNTIASGRNMTVNPRPARRKAPGI